MTPMQHDVLIIGSAPEHVEAMAARLRRADEEEIEAAGLGPRNALWRSYRGSAYAKTAFVGGEAAAMWGMGGCPLGKVGRPWLLTAPAVERAKIAFLREARAEVAMMLSICPELRGYVDAKYSGAIRLLEAIGFMVGPEFPFGPHQAPFRQYTAIRK